MNLEAILALTAADRQAVDREIQERLSSDVALIKRARVTGRVNCGTPILDPTTREVMGYEIDPIMLPAA